MTYKHTHHDDLRKENGANRHDFSCFNIIMLYYKKILLELI